MYGVLKQCTNEEVKRITSSLSIGKHWIFAIICEKRSSIEAYLVRDALTLFTVSCLKQCTNEEVKRILLSLSIGKH